MSDQPPCRCGGTTPAAPVMTPGLVRGLVEDQCGHLHAPVLRSAHPERVHAWQESRPDQVYPARRSTLGWPPDRFGRQVVASVTVDRLAEYHPALYRVRASMTFIDIDSRGSYDSERYHDRLCHDDDVAVDIAEKVAASLAGLAFETGEGRGPYRFAEALAFEEGRA